MPPRDWETEALYFLIISQSSDFQVLKNTHLNCRRYIYISKRQRKHLRLQGRALRKGRGKLLFFTFGAGENLNFLTIHYYSWLLSQFVALAYVSGNSLGLPGAHAFVPGSPIPWHFRNFTNVMFPLRCPAFLCLSGKHLGILQGSEQMPLSFIPL